jgi:hypothetical protein
MMAVAVHALQRLVDGGRPGLIALTRAEDAHRHRHHHTRHRRPD